MAMLARRTWLKLALGMATAGCTGGWATPPRPSVTAAYRSVTTKGYPAGGLLVDVEWLQAARRADPRLRLVDCSPLARYRGGHLPGAAHLWWQDTLEINNAVYGMLVGPPRRSALLGALGIDGATTVVAYDDEGGRWAARLVWLLEFTGHRRVHLLDGGTQSWLAAGQALTTGETHPPPAVYREAEQATRIIEWEELSQRLGAGLVVIDGRAADERAETWRGQLRLGQIPGAQWRPWPELLIEPAGPFRPVIELRARYAMALSASDPVVVYGLFGAAAALPYVALRALGLSAVRLYDGSWAEWGAEHADNQRPVAPLAAGPVPPGRAVAVGGTGGIG